MPESDGHEQKSAAVEASVAWVAAHRMAGHRTDLPAVCEALRENGLDSSWRTLARLGGRGLWEQVPTEPTADFVAAMIGDHPGARVLDPWAGAGVLLAAVGGADRGAVAAGLIQQPPLLAIAEQLLPNATWWVGEPLTGLAALRHDASRFDLIVSAPPNWPSAGAADAGETDRRIARLSVDQRLALSSCELLTDAGRAFFIVPNAFLTYAANGVRALLAERGYHIWSVISLPVSWNPNFSAAENVIEIRAQPTEEIFVAKVSSDSSHHVLLENLTKRKQGKVPEVGSLVASESFSTWDAFETELAFEAAARLFGGSVTQLADILSQKFLGNRTPDGGFVDRPNAVFVPTIGTSPAVTARSDLTIKPHNYIQLVIDPNRADAEYIARYFNTPLGHLTRRTVYTGAFIQKVSLRTIELAPVVLPPLEAQVRMVGLQRRLDELRTELETTARDLWRTKDGARSASRALQAFSTSGSLDVWLPRLPYPLASILWNYQATLDPRRRTEILFAFFEASAEFLTTILLSGLRSNASIYEELKAGPLSELGGVRWREASLGFWIITGMNLAKTVRRKLSDQQRPVFLELFKCSGTWLSAMASKDLFVVLQRVGELRNAWKGHGGIESDTETEQRLARLQSELTAIFSPLTLAFEDLTLVRPKSLQFDGQLFDVVAEDLVGPVVPFRESTRKSLSPMRTGRLYLVELDGLDGLELLPFVRMRAGTPAATACYFYSRLSKGGARFVSYHQAEDSEVVEEDLDLSALVDELTGTTS